MNETSPSILTYSERELSVVLQGKNIGNKSSTDYIGEIFIKLCTAPQELLDFRHIIPWDLIGKIIDPSYLGSNMQKFIHALEILKSAELLILRNEITTHGIQPMYLRICDPQSVIFYAEWITEQLVQATSAINVPLPSENTLSKSKHKIPHAIITPFESLSEQEVLKLATQYDDTDIEIYSLNTVNDVLFITNFALPQLSTLAINRLSHAITTANNKTTEAFKKITEISLQELLTALNKFDLEVLYENVEMIYNNREKLANHEYFHKHPVFLESSILLFNVLPLEIHSKQVYEEQESAIGNFTDDIFMEVRNKKVFTKSQFESLLTVNISKMNKNRQDDDSFESRFMNRFVINANDLTSSDTELLDREILIYTYTHYIYAKHATTLMLEEYKRFQEKFTLFLKKSIKGYLMGQIPENQVMFFEPKKLNSSITQFLFSDFAIFYSILKSVNFLNLLLNSPELTTSDKLTYKSIFLSPSTQELNPLFKIFNINIRKLCYDSLNHANFVEKIIMFFKGARKKVNRNLERYASMYA